VVSRNLAEALWPGSSPLGRSLLVRRPGDESEHAAGVLQEVEVVGVAPDGFFSRFYSEHRRFVFLSAQQNPAPPGETTFNIRYTGSLDLVAPAIRRALRNADARTPIVAMMTANRTIETLRWPLHALTTLLVMFAAGSLLIAGIGQYAVVSFDTRRRIRELGLRIALGASSQQILALVARESLRLTIVGLTIGFALSVAAGNAIGRVLYGVTPTDALTYVGVFTLLFVASLVACWLPARRAARIDPIMALRQE
jgi:putative ABC transport system permease protein